MRGTSSAGKGAKMRLYIRDTKNYVDVNYYEDLCMEAATVVHKADYAEAEDEDGCTCYIVSADTAEYWSNVENMQYQLDNIKSDLAEAISAPDELAEIYDDIDEAIGDQDLDDGLMAGLDTAKEALKKAVTRNN